jgi:hypothetical protein
MRLNIYFSLKERPINLPSLIILWLALPFMWLMGEHMLAFGFRTTIIIKPSSTYAAKPTPQASFSSSGS